MWHTYKQPSYKYLSKLVFMPLHFWFCIPEGNFNCFWYQYKPFTSTCKMETARKDEKSQHRISLLICPSTQKLKFAAMSDTNILLNACSVIRLHWDSIFRLHDTSAINCQNGLVFFFFCQLQVTKINCEWSAFQTLQQLMKLLQRITFPKQHQKISA